MNLTDVAMGAELFRGIAEADVELVLDRLGGVLREFGKAETVVHAGFTAERLMVVVSGKLFVYEHTEEDHPVLVRELGPGAVLGLWMLYSPEITCWPGTVVAAEDTTVISLDMARARSLKSSSAPYVAALAMNSAKLLSRELFSTWRKLTVMDAQSIEARIRIYLAEQNNESGRTGVVKVPFDRERMAEYFGVTRPALSRSLGHLRDRGLISWRKNEFRINF